MLSFLVVSICYVCRLFLFTPVINRMHWAFRSDQSIKGLSPRRARRLVQLAVLTIRMFQSKWLRCFSHTLMEGVRRDPEKCTLNPTTWSLTVVDDYVYMCLLYQRPIYSGHYSVLAIQIFWLINLQGQILLISKAIKGHTYYGIFFSRILQF